MEGKADYPLVQAKREECQERSNCSYRSRFVIERQGNSNRNVVEAASKQGICDLEASKDRLTINNRRVKSKGPDH